MANEIFMPKLSSTMTEGTVIEWFKEVGETIESGEPILEVMTDKINIEVESYHDGILLKKYYEADDVVPVNGVIGYIGESGENIPETPPMENSDEPETLKATAPTEEKSINEEITNKESNTIKTIKNLQENPKSKIGRLPATPSARAMARKNDIDISNVSGSGRKGRIHREDVVNYINEKTKANTQNISEEITQEIVSTAKLKGSQKVTAERMTESADTIPHVTMDFEVYMNQVIKLRETINDEENGIKISFNDLFITIISFALRKHPEINVTFQDNTIYYHKSINIGIAVATGDELFVPVIKNTQNLTLQSISEESKKTIKQIKEKNFTDGLMTDGTFTISNLGMYNIKQFTPIINKPQTAILGIGGMYDVVDLIDDKCVKIKKTTLSLSFDHRIINGAPAAAFCDTIKELIENPVKLLL